MSTAPARADHAAQPAPPASRASPRSPESPASNSLPWGEDCAEELDVAIVGGGFSGLVTLLHLRRLLPDARLALFERRQRPGPGVAYGACDASHLLNVPAGRMGAFPDRVGEFHAWLERREPGRHASNDFVERRLYGEYLMESAAATLAGRESRTWLVRDAIVHLQRLPTRIELLRASGTTCVARAVLLAPGLPAARAPWTNCDQGVPRHLLASDPWEPRSYADLAPDAPIVVVGSGLTAVDVLLSLRRQGHRGVVTMVSRNGRLPLPHALAGEPPMTFDASALRGGPKAVLRTLRAAASERRRAGQGWAAVLDAVRPFTSAVWQSWSDAERTRFLRRLRPFWEIHRHRAPRSVLAQLEAMRDAGTLVLARGAIARLESSSPDEVLVTLRRADGGNGGDTTLRAARLFNCVGPAMGVRDTIDPLLGSLLREGLVVADGAGLGFQSDEEGRLRGADGQIDRRLLLVGALRRGSLWESTAVPELRVQAERAARAIVEEVGG